MQQNRFSPTLPAEGESIGSSSFWGRAWRQNIEASSEFDDRLSPGRDAFDAGTVVDLQIAQAQVMAQIQDTPACQVHIDVLPLSKLRWRAVVQSCQGEIRSLDDLLAGRLSVRVTERLTRRGDGLFPEPEEMVLSCSCPDWSGLCKHQAATLYAVGARLDGDPALFFELRGTDPHELVSSPDSPETAGVVAAAGRRSFGEPGKARSDERADLLESGPTAPSPASPGKPGSPEDAPVAPPAAGPAIPQKTPAASGGTPSEPPAAGHQAGPSQETVTPPSATRRPRRRAAPASSEKPSSRSKEEPFQPQLVSMRELLFFGLSRPTVQGWLRKGILEPTGHRGIYRTTRETARHVEKALDIA